MGMGGGHGREDGRWKQGDGDVEGGRRARQRHREDGRYVWMARVRGWQGTWTGTGRRMRGEI